MTYAPRKFRPRRGRGKLTAYKVQKGSASALTQKRQIATLARKTNKLSKQLAQDRVYGQFVRQATNATLTQGFRIIPFHPDLGNRIAVFNDQTAIQNAKGFKFTKFCMDYLVQPSTEAARIDMTMFIVSLQPSVAKKVHIETSLMTNLISGDDYYSVGTALTMMNTKRFKIHYVKRLQTYLEFTDNTPQTRGFTRGYIKRRVNHNILNESGNWVDVQDVEYPLNDRMYVIIFNNNSGADLESPTITFNCLWSGHTTAW